jgi:hypothetical protein
LKKMDCTKTWYQLLFSQNGKQLPSLWPWVCEKERWTHKTHTHTHTHIFTLVPFWAWAYAPSYTDGYPFPIMKPHLLVKWHNKLVHFDDCAENNQIWFESISLPITYVSPHKHLSLSLTHLLSPPKPATTHFCAFNHFFVSMN